MLPSSMLNPSEEPARSSLNEEVLLWRIGCTLANSFACPHAQCKLQIANYSESLNQASHQKGLLWRDRGRWKISNCQEGHLQELYDCAENIFRLDEVNSKGLNVRSMKWSLSSPTTEYVQCWASVPKWGVQDMASIWFVITTALSSI